MAELSLESVVVRRGDVLGAPVDDELVMLDPRQGRYFGMDAIGLRIWELLAQPQTVHALCSKLEREFQVSADTCRRDVLEFLSQLSDAALLELR
jgi:hypothetical protein